MYLAADRAANTHVDNVVGDALAARAVKASAVLTTPAPFNILLWRTVVEPDGYLEGYYSLPDSLPDRRRRPEFQRQASEPALLDGIAESRDVRRLQWFSEGFCRVRAQDNRVAMTDLRMGGHPYYAFSFVVGEYSDGTTRAVPAKRLGREMPHPPETGARCPATSGIRHRIGRSNDRINKTLQTL
jgi:inner membrane protein